MTENNTYTTGELADACGTTVQYYDQKGLLAPSGYSEGGRRMYADGDAERLRFILMLKTLGAQALANQGNPREPESRGDSRDASRGARIATRGGNRGRARRCSMASRSCNPTSSSATTSS